MKIILIPVMIFLFNLNLLYSQDKLPVKGFCIGAPSPSGVDAFVDFIAKELQASEVNTLIVRIDYSYRFKSHPELITENALSEQDIKKIVTVCKNNNIRLIPLIDLLGHQSWAEHLGKLLSVYPEFDETPGVKMPEKYKWPNDDGLYCKSYCPLHPDVHKVIFDLVDEICDVFEADAFHAGMDEVFYLGEEGCIRCNGKDKSELFAGEVNLIRNHLALKGRKLWIWGDRLIDGKTTGIGMWEASENDTYRAIDMIEKDVVICDWHYERPDQTPVYFAMKGFNVITCPWRNPENAITQCRDIYNFRKVSTSQMKERYLGMMQTVWFGADQFINDYNKPNTEKQTEAACFRAWINEVKQQEQF